MAPSITSVNASVTLSSLSLVAALHTQNYLLGDEQSVASLVNLGMLVAASPVPVPSIYVSTTYTLVHQNMYLTQGRFRLWAPINPAQPSTCSGGPPGVWSTIDT